MAVLLSLALALISGAQVKLIRPIFDNGLKPGATLEEILYLAGMILGLAILNFPVRFYHFYLVRYAVERATCDVRESLFDKIQKMPTPYFTQNKQGVLIAQVMNDTATFAHGFRSFIDLIREPLKAIVYLSIAFWSDWQLTMVIFLVAPFLSLIFQKSGKIINEKQKEVLTHTAELTHNVAEGISSNRLAKAFNLRHYLLIRFKHIQGMFMNSLMRSITIEEVAHPLVELVGAVAFSGVIVFAYFRINSGATTVGEFVSFIAALALFMDPVRKFSQANVKVSQAAAAGQRIFKLLNAPEEVDHGNYEITDGFKESVYVKNLTFSYGEGDVLKSLSLNIHRGEKIALVGLSGSGKSTLINLLLGLYPVKRGEITIDGHDINDIKLHSLRNLFGLVSQDIFLFNDTVLNNLTMGKHFSDEKIAQALDVAYAHDFVRELPHGLETLVGDRGVLLSGGQKQRITIARAFLHDAPILLFDEATSALDNESEKIVQKALNSIAGHKTVIAVAHRLSTIKNFDRIYVLKEGNLIEQGNHEQLVKHAGEYAKLYQLSLSH